MKIKNQKKGGGEQSSVPVLYSIEKVKYPNKQGLAEGRKSEKLFRSEDHTPTDGITCNMGPKTRRGIPRPRWGAQMMRGTCQVGDLLPSEIPHKKKR